MVGAGNSKAEGPFNASNSNGFAALGNLSRKKKSEKEMGSSKVTERSKDATKEAKPPVYWAPAPLTVKSWADVGDEDDDDYFATTTTPQAIWGKPEESKTPDPVEESESEDELPDEGDDYLEEYHDHEQEVQEQPEPTTQKTVEVSPAPKETERQLSKKERRKKDLAEFDAILANFGVNPKEKAEEESSVVIKEIKDGGLNGDLENKDPSAESKSAKKKKKKNKAPKEVKESLDLPKNSDSPDGPEETTETKQVKEGTSAGVLKLKVIPNTEKKKPTIVYTKKKKSNNNAAARFTTFLVAGRRFKDSSRGELRIWVKKEFSKIKKSSKEIDAAVGAASVEAAARSAKLVAAKKKEKNHYNPQPTR